VQEHAIHLYIMKLFKKVTRILYLVLVIILATLGIGLVGPIPLEITHKRETQEHPIELVKSEDESESESDQIKIVQ